MKPKVSIVLPTYNESQNIPLIVEKIETALKGIPFEIIVVDDDSPDRTWEVAKNLNKSYVKSIRRCNVRGLSSAVLDGFGAAEGQYLCVMDADMQHDEGIVPQMLQELDQGADMAVGSRKVTGGSLGNFALHRRFVSWTATQMAKLVLVQPVSDPMSGFFIIRREVFESCGTKINPRGFKILLEFLAAAHNIKVVEVGYVFRGRVHGESKLSSEIILDYLEALYDLSIGKWISRRFFNYSLVGVSGIIVNQAGLYFARETLKLEDSHALMLGIEISILSNFILNNLWTFRKVKMKGPLQWLRGLLLFHTVCLAGAVINHSVALFMTHQFAIDLYLANLIGISVAMIWNYIVNSNITWTSRRKKPS